MTQAADYERGGTQKSWYGDDEVVTWACPLCGSEDGARLKTERGNLGVFTCAKCELMRINPRVKAPDEVYRGKQDVYEEEFREVVKRGKPHHRDKNYLHDLALIEQHKPTGRFLDIGTNTGSFLRLARGRGWELTGIEPSPQLGELARKWWGLNIIEGFIEKLPLPAAHFDVVTMTDVFEHVVNPREVLAAIRRALKPDGVVFIKVPNGRFNVFKYRARKALGKKEADDFDAYEHVCHYTEETLRAMLATEGFDAFRVDVERPIQTPVWHHYVGRYYQHPSPFSLAWKHYTGRQVLFQAARLEAAVTRHVGWLAPNIGCFARLKSS